VSTLLSYQPTKNLFYHKIIYKAYIKYIIIVFIVYTRKTKNKAFKRAGLRTKIPVTHFKKNRFSEENQIIFPYTYELLRSL